MRWTTPKPSETKASPRAASSLAKARRSASSFEVSPGWKRRFSRTATRPSSSPATTSWAEGPTVSVAKATSWPSSSPSRPTTGRREYFSSGAPLGRPRWEITATRAPASTSRVRVGSAARMRPSSVIVVPSSGTFRSARTSTRLPRSSPSESRVFSTMVLLGVLAPAPGGGAGGRSTSGARRASAPAGGVRRAPGRSGSSAGRRRDQRDLPTRAASSTRRLEKPHSLSYQEKILTWLPITLVSWASKIAECASPSMSLETIGSSV